MSPRVPPELCDEIINYLSDDKEALKACSLSSRNFTALSQKLFFSRVVIHTSSSSSSPATNLIVELTQPQCELGGSPLKFRVLLDTSPHIADYIECLQMINIGPFSNDQLETYNKSLPHCLPHINKLKALVICGLHSWPDFSPETWSSILRLFQLPSLIHLDLSAAPDWLLDCALGPNVKHLCVRHHTDFFNYRHFSSVPRPPDSSPIYLDSLMTHHSHRDPSVEEFSRVKIGRLRKLVVQEVWCGLKESGAMSLLQLCCDSLEELTIIPQLDEAANFDECDPDSFLDLSKFNSLRVLVVHLWRLDDFYQLDYIDWLGRLIHACSSSNKTLRHFIIRLAYTNETAELRKADWEEHVFRALFDDAAFLFPCLETLTVLITVNDEDGRDRTSWCSWFDKSKYVRKLRSKRNINVEVVVVRKTELGNLAPLRFACDARWECVVCGNDRRGLVTDVPGLRRPVSFTVTLD